MRNTLIQVRMMMKLNSCLLGAVTITAFAAQIAVAAPDVTKLLTQAEVEAALSAKVTTSTRQLPAPLGGTQITYTSSGLPVKTFAITLRTDDSFAPGMKAGGYTAAKLYSQDKSFGKTEPFAVKGGDGFTTATRTEILKKGMQLSATTLFGASKEAQAARNGLLLKAANRL